MEIKHSIRKKLIVFVVMTVIAATVSIFAVSEASLFKLRGEAENGLVEQAIATTSTYTEGQAKVINEEVEELVNLMNSTALYTENLYKDPDSFEHREVKSIEQYGAEGVKGELTFHYITSKAENMYSRDVLDELEIISGLEPLFSVLRQKYPQFTCLALYTSTGINIGYDDIVDQKVGISEFDPVELGKEYYIVPNETLDTYVSDVYEDSFGRGLTITVSAPYFVNGEFRGVVTGDALVGTINDIVTEWETPFNDGYKILLNSGGKLQCSPSMQKGDNLETIFGDYAKTISDKVLNEGKGFVSSVAKGQDVYVFYDNSIDCGWSLLTIIPVSSILKPAQSFGQIISQTNITAAVLCFLLLVILGSFGYLICRRLLSPFGELTEKISAITGDNIDYVSEIHTGDEVELLSHKFERVVVHLKEYVEKLMVVTAEKERVSAELDVAKNIQASMLPCIFPPYPDRAEFDIVACMNPAKEVGGDFYDFFMIDDSHIAIVMADVSGKGIPAALFMVIGKTLIKDHTVSGINLGDVFANVNNMLCESNSEEMFITAFEAVLDLKTGYLEFVNAGHEMPFISKKDGAFEIHKVKPGFVLAGMEGIKYTTGSIKIEPGTRIFLYTDGVPEATDANEELFGMTRLENTLNTIKDCRLDEILPKVRGAVDEFVGEAPQFDDLTMLCLEFKEYMK